MHSNSAAPRHDFIAIAQGECVLVTEGRPASFGCLANYFIPRAIIRMGIKGELLRLARGYTWAREVWGRGFWLNGESISFNRGGKSKFFFQF
jgi:hypothetical protein